MSWPRIGVPRPRLTFGEDVWITEVCGRLDDRLRPRRRVVGLEDARPHEDGLGPELHHQRRVGRGGDAAGAEQRYRQRAGLGDLLDEPDG